MTMKERAKFVQCQSVVRVPKVGGARGQKLHPDIQVTLNVGGAAADENYTMCGPSFQVLCPSSCFLNFRLSQIST